MKQNRLMDPDQFSRWWDSPATKAFRDYLARRRENLMEAWGSGAVMSPEAQMEAYLCSQISDLTPEAVAHVFGVELEGDE